MADVPQTPRGHLGLIFFDAALTVVRLVMRQSRGLDQFPFLDAYLAELRPRLPWPDDLERSAPWLRREIASWEEKATEVFMPLRAARTALGLGAEAVRTVGLLGLVEEDAAFGAVFEVLQAGSGHRRPTVTLLRDLLVEDQSGADPWPALDALTVAGLIEVVDPEAPRSEWLYRVPPAVWTAIRGERPEPQATVRWLETAPLPVIDELIVAEEQRARLREVLMLLRRNRARVIILRGPIGCERREVIGALAKGLNRDLLVVQHIEGVSAGRLGALAALSGAVPLFELELGPGETFTLPGFAAYRGPVAVIATQEGGIVGAEQPAMLELAPDPPELRRRHWRRALGAAVGPEIDLIAERFAFSGGHIRLCAEYALGRAHLEGRDRVQIDDVRAGVRMLGRPQLGALAERLEPEGGGWDRLVVSSATRAQLQNLEARARQREHLATTCDGFPGGLNRGLRALFEGPSGTGKTLAARVLAEQLGLEVYRVDLSAVVNKYVGETEKNLARVLGRAEDLDVILLLDEGDALMARRTSVRNANDRYANLETNYLLQRLETFQGIVLVTTNLGSQGGIDPAFRRRMDASVRFHAPGPEERWHLWLVHLGPGHAIPADALEEIAVRYPFTGGQIRNAVADAAIRALCRGGCIAEDDLLAALETEHRKTGAAFAPPEAELPVAAADGLDAFLGVIG